MQKVINAKLVVICVRVYERQNLGTSAPISMEFGDNKSIFKECVFSEPQKIYPTQRNNHLNAQKYKKICFSTLCYVKISERLVQYDLHRVVKYSFIK